MATKDVPAFGKTDTDQIEREARVASAPLSARLCGTWLRVKNPKDWPASSIRDTRAGDFDSWAEKCLVRDDSSDDYSIWKRLDPTLGHVEDFYREIGEVSGQHPGK